MANHDLDEKLLDAIRAGHATRPKLMAIEHLRHRTWAVVAQRLDALTKRGALVYSKAGWRLGKPASK